MIRQMWTFGVKSLWSKNRLGESSRRFVYEIEDIHVRGKITCKLQRTHRIENNLRYVSLHLLLSSHHTDISYGTMHLRRTSKHVFHGLHQPESFCMFAHMAHVPKWASEAGP
jgi:hypothetical protein